MNIRNTGHYSRIFTHHLNSNACVLVLLREDTKKSILRESYCQLGLSSTSNKPKMVDARYCASWFVFVPHSLTLPTIIYPMLYSNLFHTLPYPFISTLTLIYTIHYHTPLYPTLTLIYTILYHTPLYPTLTYPMTTLLPITYPHSPNPISYPTSISCTNQPTYLVPYIVLIPIRRWGFEIAKPKLFMISCVFSIIVSNMHFFQMFSNVFHMF